MSLGTSSGFHEDTRVTRLLPKDADVDATYISTPHPFHKDNALLCLEHILAVLCKPFGINTKEALETIRAARDKRLLLMEARWTCFLPHMIKVRELLSIGEVRMLKADFGFRADTNPKGRLFNPVLGGGALLDVGTLRIPPQVVP